MLHLDLFSGIGGFAYAVDEVWPNSEHIFCDFDPFCQKVLKKHWPGSVVYDDIRAITADTRRKRRSERSSQSSQGQEAEWGGTAEEIERLRSVEIVTGGFPCQPFSAAGVRRGTADERYLWPEMLRVIRLTKPTWVIAENVRGLLTWENGLVFEQICSDLESSGYEVQPFIIPAVAVNAPHRRDRIWWVAFNSKHDRPRREERGSDGTQSEVSQKHRSQDSTARQFKRTDSDRQDEELNTDPERQRRQRGSSKDTRRPRQHSGNGNDQRPDWDKNWLEVATQFCSVDDGLPVELDGLKLTKARNRAEQLKAYGNAIVPAVAIEIMKGIKNANINPSNPTKEELE